MLKHKKNGKFMKKDNTRAVSNIVFYYNRKSIIFKVLGAVVCCFIEKCVCVDYLSLRRKREKNCHQNKFVETLFDKLTGTGIL